MNLLNSYLWLANNLDQDKYYIFGVKGEVQFKKSPIYLNRAESRGSIFDSVVDKQLHERNKPGYKCWQKINLLNSLYYTVYNILILFRRFFSTGLLPMKPNTNENLIVRDINGPGWVEWSELTSGSKLAVRCYTVQRRVDQFI